MHICARLIPMPNTNASPKSFIRMRVMWYRVISQEKYIPHNARFCASSLQGYQRPSAIMLGFCIHNVVGNSEVYYKTFHSFFILDIFKNPKMSILQKVIRLLFCVFYEFLKYFLQQLNKNETTHGVKDVHTNNP